MQDKSTQKLTARDFAIIAHGDQRYNGEPYVVHLDEVAAVLREFGVTDPTLIDAAYLHDVLEDTSVRHWDLAVKFPCSYWLVRVVTDQPGINRKERKAATYPKIAANPGATTLKLADRIANTRRAIKERPRLLQMYRDEYPDFRKALRVVGENDEMWICLDDLWSKTGDALDEISRKKQ